MGDKAKGLLTSGVVSLATGLLTVALLWFFTVRDDLHDIKKDVETLQEAHEDDNEIALRLQGLETAVNLIGGHMGIKGFPTLGPP